MCKYIVFDFDDTITYNNILDYMSFKITCNKLGILHPSINKIAKLRRRGFLAKNIIKKICRYQKNEKIIREFLEYRKKFLLNNSLQYLKLRPNSKAVLSNLHKSKYNLILCSANINGSMVKTFLKKNDLFKLFAGVFFIKDLGFVLDNSIKSNRVLIKNSLLHHIIKKFEIPLNEILYIGNSIEDYKSAKIMKVNFIFLKTSYLPEIKIRNIKSISSLNDLQKILLKMRNLF